MQVAVLNRVDKVGLIEKVAVKQRLEEGGGVSHMGIWGKSVPGRGNRQHKGSEAVMCLACSRNSKKTSVANVE